MSDTDPRTPNAGTNLSVVCHFCGAKGGEKCQSRQGDYTAYVHRPRHERLNYSKTTGPPGPRATKQDGCTCQSDIHKPDCIAAHVASDSPSPSPEERATALLVQLDLEPPLYAACHDAISQQIHEAIQADRAEILSTVSEMLAEASGHAATHKDGWTGGQENALQRVDAAIRNRSKP